MLVTSIFSFFQNVFYLTQNIIQFLSHIYCVVYNCPSWASLKILSYGKGLKEGWIQVETPTYLAKKLAAGEALGGGDKDDNLDNDGEDGGGEVIREILGGGD